eukprot:TRINITY_DN2192_c0_g1_i1.p1 TRINITY_DN2192_c0_g1~~TRINITY_DN2192_c0_g1_i1.p1  ORF type:complete len:161 (-),score=25.36 TRINITY_DN2192_c0_g1_i1:86-568(-)
MMLILLTLDIIDTIGLFIDDFLILLILCGCMLMLLILLIYIHYFLQAILTILVFSPGTIPESFSSILPTIDNHPPILNQNNEPYIFPNANNILITPPISMIKEEQRHENFTPIPYNTLPPIDHPPKIHHGVSVLNPMGNYEDNRDTIRRPILDRPDRKSD